jgi:hypothetical protein
MFRTTFALAALGLMAAAGSASAQEVGGVHTRNSPLGVLNRIGQLQPGCPLARTNVAVGVNPVLGAGAQSQQSITSIRGGCRPLVSTQVAAGVNVAAGPGSSAGQSVEAVGPRGLLATTTIGRGVNIAAGPRSFAGQSIFSQTGR